MITGKVSTVKVRGTVYDGQRITANVLLALKGANGDNGSLTGLTEGRVALIGAGNTIIDDAGITYVDGKLTLGTMQLYSFTPEIGLQNNYFIGDAGNKTMGGISTTHGIGNVGFGVNVLKNLTTGSFNTAIGRNCMAANTTGGNNFALGDQAMNSNISGSSNTAIGSNALWGNISGLQNLAFGNFALLLNDGSYNTAVGTGALQNNTSGNNNIALGYQAGRFNRFSQPLDGINDCIFIGQNAKGGYPGTLTNAIVIGKDAIAFGDNTAAWGGSSIQKNYFSGTINLQFLNTAPASASATGSAGEIRFTTSGIFVCTATNTWRKADLNIF